jgi:uncharacterized protein YpmB
MPFQLPNIPAFLIIVGLIIVVLLMFAAFRVKSNKSAEEDRARRADSAANENSQLLPAEVEMSGRI